jgi:hypothetical protein
VLGLTGRTRGNAERLQCLHAASIGHSGDFIKSVL